MEEEMEKRTLKRNDTGEAVRALARLLVERGHLKEPSNIFDLTLKHAVEEFQARHVDERGHPLVVRRNCGAYDLVGSGASRQYRHP